MKLVVRLLLIAACLTAAPANSYWQSRQQVASDQDTPAADLNFAAGTVSGSCSSFANCLTVSRAQTVPSYAQTISGMLTAFSADTPRITDQGLLIEGSATNFNLQSQALNDATGWPAATNITVTADATTAPDSTTTADMLTDNANNTAHSLSSSNQNYTSGSTYTLTTYLKAGTASFAQIVWGAGTGAMGFTFYANINLSTCTITAAAAGLTTGTTSLSSGWCRAWMTGTAVTTGTSSAAIAGITNGTAARGQAYVGTGTTFYCWGVQAELGAFPSSYIPTTTVAVTRAADNVTSAGALDTALKATPGSLVIQNNPIIPMTSFVATPPSLTSFSGGWTSIAFGATTARVSDGTNNIDATFGAGSFAGLAKTGIAYDGTTGSIVANNGTVGTGTLLRTTATGNNNLGNVAALNRSINGYIPRLTVWNTRLSDTSLKALTQ